MTKTGHSSHLRVVVAMAILVAIVALLIWAGAVMRIGVGTEDTNPKPGSHSALIHDDAWNLPRNAGSAPIHDDPWNFDGDGYSGHYYPLPPGKEVANPSAADAGSAVIHDDAGDVHPD